MTSPLTLYLFTTMAADWGISRRLWLIGSDCTERSITPEIGNICSHTSVRMVLLQMAVQLLLKRGLNIGGRRTMREWSALKVNDGRSVEKEKQIRRRESKGVKMEEEIMQN